MKVRIKATGEIGTALSAVNGKVLVQKANGCLEVFAVDDVEVIKREVTA